MIIAAHHGRSPVAMNPEDALMVFESWLRIGESDHVQAPFAQSSQST